MITHVFSSLIFFLILTNLSIGVNPDERTSLTLRVGADFLSGDYSSKYSFWEEDNSGNQNLRTVFIRQNDKVRNQVFSSLLTIPRGDNISLLFEFKYFDGKDSGDKTQYLWDYETTRSGISINAGVKFFLGK